MSSVTVSWHDPDETIVYYQFEGKWDWNDFYPAYQQAIDMEKSKPYRVDVIVDLRGSGHMPPNVLLHMKNISDKQPDNIGLSVLVTTNRVMHSIYSVGVRFYDKIGHYFVLAPTPEAAQAMITASRESASHLPH
jgi:hypothetical protein